MKFALNLQRRDVPDPELIADVQRSVLRRSEGTPSRWPSTRKRAPSIRPPSPGASAHGSVCLRSRASRRADRSCTDQELFDNLRLVWISLARQPRYTEMRSPVSKFSAGTYENRFGTWNSALQAFVGWVEEGKSDSYDESVAVAPERARAKRRTKRDISERLRFSILLRDGFRCLACGRSPLKTPGVELHIDHIMPWSEGGETVSENLETKCIECNLGKGNAFKK
jgi:5-methylcytosine-specific restriction endonuclease McrA